MFDEQTRQSVIDIFSSCEDVVAVYLFGSCLDNKEDARDVDLALLLKEPGKSQVDIYMNLYPQLAEALAPLEPDLMFLHSVSLPVRFEAIAKGKLIFSRDDHRRTDFEYAVSGEYMDFKYHLDMARRELFEAIKEGSLYV